MRHLTDHTLLYNHPSRIVRDLAWVLLSPQLLDASYTGFRTARFQPHVRANDLFKRLSTDGYVGEGCGSEGCVAEDSWYWDLWQSLWPHLLGLWDDPTPLHQWISTRPHKLLGRYFEALLAYALHSSPEISGLKTGIVIQEGGRSIGELDFVFEHRPSGRLIHLEVAVKFYLRLVRGTTAESFVGPQETDRLSRKIQVMLEKQIPLSDVYFSETYHAGSTSLPIQKLLFLKGCLFSHVDDASLKSPSDGSSGPSRLDLIPGISEKAPQGLWVRWGEWVDFLRRRQKARWVVLSKREWLAPARVDDESAAMDFNSITAVLEPHFTASPATPVQVAQLEPEGSGLREVERIFVVSDSWMKAALAPDL